MWGDIPDLLAHTVGVVHTQKKNNNKKEKHQNLSFFVITLALLLLLLYVPSILRCSTIIQSWVELLLFTTSCLKCVCSLKPWESCQLFCLHPRPDPLDCSTHSSEHRHWCDKSVIVELLENGDINWSYFVLIINQFFYLYRGVLSLLLEPAWIWLVECYFIYPNTRLLHIAGAYNRLKFNFNFRTSCGFIIATDWFFLFIFVRNVYAQCQC